MEAWHLAQINIARLIAPLDDPQIADFVADLAPINALADSSEGFVWRLQSASGNATDIAFTDDPFLIVNMSVWESLGSLRNFTYRSRHVEVFRKRAAWFEPHTQPPYCLWWTPAGQLPNVREGRERLEHYRRHGASEHAFWFSQPYPKPVAVYA